MVFEAVEEEYKEEPSRTVPPSVTDTDSNGEESDPEETTFVARSMTTETSESRDARQALNSIKAYSSKCSDDFRLGEEVIRNEAVELESDVGLLDGSSKNGKAAFTLESSIDESVPSVSIQLGNLSNPDMEKSPRVTNNALGNNTDIPVECTKTKSAPSLTQSTPADEETNFVLNETKSQIPIRTVEDKEHQVFCHPSKLARDNSLSALQPSPTLRQSNHKMAPNVRTVEEEPNEFIDVSNVQLENEVAAILESLSALGKLDDSPVEQDTTSKSSESMKLCHTDRSQSTSPRSSSKEGLDTLGDTDVVHWELDVRTDSEKIITDGKNQEASTSGLRMTRSLDGIENPDQVESDSAMFMRLESLKVSTNSLSLSSPPSGQSTPKEGFSILEKTAVGKVEAVTTRSDNVKAHKSNSTSPTGWSTTRKDHRTSHNQVELDTTISTRSENGRAPTILPTQPNSPAQSGTPRAIFDESQDSRVVAPPGTVVIQHMNGEHSFAALHQPGSFSYPMQVIQPAGLSHQVQPIRQQMVPGAQMPPSSGGRRKITLRLEEDVKDSSKKSFFFRRKSRSFGDGVMSIEGDHGIERGSVTISWFEGTSSAELQEHVRKSVVRKLQLPASTQLVDLRIIDQSIHPHEEIVLSPFIPDGSTFLLRFAPQAPEKNLFRVMDRMDSSAPESPSASPSPFASSANLARLNAQLLSGKLDDLRRPLMSEPRKSILKQRPEAVFELEEHTEENHSEDNILIKKVDDADASSKGSDHHEDDVADYSPEDQIEARLRQLADLLIADRKSRKSTRSLREKRQVVFVIANYFVVFLCLIAISAELSARAPKWLQWVESQFQSVQKCSMDQDALFECVSKGDFAGLVASFIIFLSRSAATHKFFLFGFDTPKKLWTVVYESMVTALCWGASYLIIRRGMNPDTRSGFMRKYWKDAVYGSLAGFNASFMKSVLKNLIPQEAFEDALLQERQLKILSWLPSFR